MPEVLQVTKVFTFDMAHALYGYDGPCRNIHGHTYHLHVTISGVVNEDPDDPKVGMVIDFGTIKDIVRREVVDTFDHALVLHRDAPYSKDGFLTDHFEKIVLFDRQPSCEQLLLHFRDLVKKSLPKGVVLSRMRLDETPTSYAEWLKAD